MTWMGRSLIFNLLKRFIRLKFPFVQRMTTVEFNQRLSDSEDFHPLILDARSEKEYAVSHLAAARRIDVTSDFTAEQALKEVSKNTPIIIYCSVGYRSAKVAQRLKQADFSHVFNLEGGLFQWANEERPMLCNGQLTQLIHPYNAMWGNLLKRRDRLQE